ncbi:MAG: hypothetical protein HKP01_02895 [Gemmatimonadetes bacterium]|nr:hypothetical protein [Gemmatimonadota bacterium]
MKRWMLLPLAVLMLMPASLAAQEDASPTWWAVFTEQVPPADVMAFEEASAKALEAIKANAPADMVYYTQSGMETGYSYAIPMESMTDFMMMNEQWMGMINEIGWENWEAMSAKSDAMVEQRSMNFYVELPDQSYHPEGFVESMADKPARHYDWIYPKSGMEDELAEVMKEWVALYAEHGIDNGWTAYQAVSGDNLPMVVLITPTTTAAAYYAMSEEVDQILGEAGQEMMMKSMAMMRKFEHNDWMYRPELSLVPEEM